MRRQGNGLRALLVAALNVAFVFAVASSFPAAAAEDTGWGVATVIEDNAYNSSGAAVATDLNGNTVTVWSQYDRMQSNIWANRFVPGIGWEGPTKLGLGGHPQVAMDADGNAIVVADGWATRFVPGVGWGSPELIGTGYGAPLAMDSRGNAVAVWRVNSTQISSIRFVPGVGWGDATLVEANFERTVSLPQVAMDADGNAIAMWGVPQWVNNNIQSSRFVPDVGWGTPTPVGTGGLSPRYDLAMDPDGNAVAVWCASGVSCDAGPIVANRFVPDRGWGSPTTIGTLGEIGFFAGDPQVAMDPSGNAVAVWYDHDTARSNISANRFVPGVGWGTPTIIAEEAAPSSVGGPHVAMDADGKAIAVWIGAGGVWASRFVPETGWGTAARIDADGGGAGSPEVAVDPRGNAIAAWDQFDGTRWNIWANRFVALPAPVLSLTSPADGLTASVPTVTVSGTTEPDAHLVVNGLVVAVSPTGTFSFELALKEGTNVITAAATNGEGKSTTISRTVTYVNPVPALEQELQETRDELGAMRRALEDTRAALDTANASLAALGTQVVVGFVAIVGVASTLQYLLFRRLRSRGLPATPPRSPGAP